MIPKACGTLRSKDKLEIIKDLEFYLEITQKTLKKLQSFKKQVHIINSSMNPIISE